ncbi:MAG: phage tail tape measure protein [Pseudomonadota bacterium]
MSEETEDIIVPVKADFSGFSAAMEGLSQQSKRFASTFTGTMARAIRDGRSFEGTLKSLALQLSNMALSAGLKPLEGLIGSTLQSATSGLTSLFTGASSAGITPFAKGGLVAQPTYFSSGGKPGVMGEAGAEAIVPLARGADGRLGVRSADGGAVNPVHVTFNISTPDVDGFQKSQGQISTLLARTVARGRRGL